MVGLTRYAMKTLKEENRTNEHKEAYLSKLGPWDWHDDHALIELEVDLFRLNERDRDEIDRLERRREYRTRLIKRLRRRFARKGLVNVSTDSGNPMWIRRDSVI